MHIREDVENSLIVGPIVIDISPYSLISRKRLQDNKPKLLWNANNY